MKKAERSRPKDPDRDLDQEMNKYEPLDHDDNGMLLLERELKSLEILERRNLHDSEDCDFEDSDDEIDKAKSKRDANSDGSEDETFDIDNEKIKQDFSKLTKREKLALLQKQSPEFARLIADFKGSEISCETERLNAVLEKLNGAIKHPVQDIADGRCLAIERWVKSHSRQVEYLEDDGLQFLYEIFRDENCWVDRILLNKDMLGQILTKECMNEIKNPFSRYNMACRYCIVDKIIPLFRLFEIRCSPDAVAGRQQPVTGNDMNVRNVLLEALKMYDPVLIFWIDEESEDLKLKEHSSVDGFRKATCLEWKEGMEYFYNRLNEQERSNEITNAVISFSTPQFNYYCATALDFCLKKATRSVQRRILLKLSELDRAVHSLVHGLIRWGFLDTVQEIMWCWHYETFESPIEKVLSNLRYSLLLSPLFEIIQEAPGSGFRAKKIENPAITKNRLEIFVQFLNENFAAQKTLSFTPLHVAAAKGSLLLVETLLKDGFDIDSEIKFDGFTPLYYAIAKNRLEVVEFLIARGANVNHKIILGFTPLSFACQLGYSGIVSALIAKGANLCTRTDKFNTPLHLAAQNGHLDVVNVLIGKGFDIDAVSNDQCRPLHDAVQNGNIDVVKTLLLHGCNVNAACLGSGPNRIDTEISPLHLGAMTGKLDIVKALLKAGANVNAKTGDKVTPLHIASQSGFSELVDVLLKAKSKVNARDYENATPLHLAAHRGHFDVVESLLLVKGIDVDARGHEKATALHVASQHGHLKVVKLLIRKRANIKAKKDGDFTPLHLALQQSHFEVSDFLIENGALIHCVDDQGWTPLHNAAWAQAPTDTSSSSVKIVETLIAKRANVNAKINDGRRALHLAAELNHWQIMDCLIKNGADVEAVDRRYWTPLHCAAYDGRLEAVKCLIDKGANINAKTTKRTSPLHFAVNNDHLAVVEYLLEKGANVNLLDHTNWTPLHFAAETGFGHMATVLLKHGADLEAREVQDNATALHLAAQYSHFNVIKILVASGADVNSKMNRNVTPLHSAAQAGNLNIVKYLLSKGAYFDAICDLIFALPLHLAERSRNFEVIKLLRLTENLFKAVKGNNQADVENSLKSGAPVDSRSIRFQTPLIYASWKGYFNIVNVLLKNCANVNCVNDNNLTPLHYAAKFNHLEIVYALLKMGSIFDVASTKGNKKPVDLARDAGNTKIVDLLQTISNLFEGAVGGDQKLFEKLKLIKDRSTDEFLAITNARNSQD